MLRFMLAALAGLAVSPLATAGPISWGYRAVNPAGIVVAEKSGITDEFWSDFFLPDPRQFGEPVPDPNPGNGLISEIWRSSATVTIIDENSGQSGELPIFRQFIFQYELEQDGSRDPIFEGEDGGPFWPDEGVLWLGGNVYRMRTPGGEMMIAVEPGPGPPPLQTPEPGTFALAGLGLGALGLVRRLRRGAAVAALVALGLFGGAGSAQAGPIPWSYSAEFGPDRPVGHYGDIPLEVGTIPGLFGPYDIHARLYDFVVHDVPSAGSQRVLVGTLFGHGVWINPPPPPETSACEQFLSDLTITDAASGEFGRVSVFGRGVYFGDDELLDPRVRLQLLDDGRRELTLGGNKYEIAYSIVQLDGNRASSLVVDVTVGPVSATPEPGTLALAGLGLGAVFARRLRR